MYPIEKYDFKVYEKTNEDGTKSSVVVAISKYAGKIVKGVAKCSQDDAFSLEAGTKLAAARCDFKVCLKRKNRAEKRKHEVAIQVEKLTEEYNKMCDYYNDALDEAFKSAERLAEIQKQMM